MVRTMTKYELMQFEYKFKDDVTLRDVLDDFVNEMDAAIDGERRDSWVFDWRIDQYLSRGSRTIKFYRSTIKTYEPDVALYFAIWLSKWCKKLVLRLRSQDGLIGKGYFLCDRGEGIMLYEEMASFDWQWATEPENCAYVPKENEQR